MKKFVALGLAWLLAGCVSLPPLSQEGVKTVKSSPTAVLFSDDVGQLTYLEDHYYVLAVTQTSSNSIYRGVWDSDKDMSALVAGEFSKLGVQATSVHDVLAGQDIAALKGTAGEKFMFKGVEVKPEGKSPPAVAPALRDALMAKGYKHLIWSSWSGPLLHIQTLGLTPRFSSVSAHRVVDLEKNEVMGAAVVSGAKPVDLGEATGKEAMEKGGLAGLKQHSADVVRAPFELGVVAQEIGFVPKEGQGGKKAR